MKKITEVADNQNSIKLEIENEKMISRRQALRKLGFGAGLAAFYMLGVDDFARIAYRSLIQHRNDNSLVNEMEKEFKNAGVAFADGDSPYSSSGPCTYFAAGDSTQCSACNEERYAFAKKVGTSFCVTGASIAVNCGYRVCGNATPLYSDLQACWAPYCSACLANCS
jgi:hypothetical protein